MSRGFIICKICNKQRCRCVQAVNSHQVLLDACRDAMEFMTYKVSAERQMKIFAAVKDAIREAEGQ